MTKDWLEKLFAEKAEQRFYGELIFVFVDGKITLAKENKSMKPPSVDADPRF